eukprot:CAMPEP_0119285362 /NCGR_PEP_ID=MMETSP1329-20130426/32043_1 /TAXON_ID=114041 /ORGANISM="Genus nov. species nov., Strain RCC1024" /LENGTH=290 /DNA_ID=CAMNT_0007286073 /DNA_START=190 /DNA_END=1059 /DNA_ORIENTATION=+
MRGPPASILLAVMLGSAAADEGYAPECEWRRKDYGGWCESEDCNDHAWGGFKKCERLRCDAETRTLWVRVNEKLWTEREKYSKGHEKAYRSYCMVLNEDGRMARYARYERRQRQERWMWREREREDHVDAHAWSYRNTTGSWEWTQGEELQPSDWGAEQYAACARECNMTCDELAARDAGLGLEAEFAELYAATLADGADPFRPPRVCFVGDDDWRWFFGWVTWVHALFLVVLIATLLGAWCLGCCVSNRCCWGYGALQTLRNEFADSCPRLAGCLRVCCLENRVCACLG